MFSNYTLHIIVVRYYYNNNLLLRLRVESSTFQVKVCLDEEPISGDWTSLSTFSVSLFTNPAVRMISIMQQRMSMKHLITTDYKRYEKYNTLNIFVEYQISSFA